MHDPHWRTAPSTNPEVFAVVPDALDWEAVQCLLPSVRMTRVRAWPKTLNRLSNYSWVLVVLPPGREPEIGLIGDVTRRHRISVVLVCPLNPRTVRRLGAAHENYHVVWREEMYERLPKVMDLDPEGTLDYARRIMLLARPVRDRMVHRAFSRLLCSGSVPRSVREWASECNLPERGLRYRLMTAYPKLSPKELVDWNLLLGVAILAENVEKPLTRLRVSDRRVRRMAERLLRTSTIRVHASQALESYRRWLQSALE